MSYTAASRYITKVVNNSDPTFLVGVPSHVTTTVNTLLSSRVTFFLTKITTTFIATVLIRHKYASRKHKNMTYRFVTCQMVIALFSEEAQILFLSFYFLRVFRS
ncbi:hypothetical protein PNOK_0650200 [Pyrrhoderma noxium]|uniref:Uncharacterized protein n=1 Tax=Pyrrhoderma noxium TaxID=2282107 RepID=A0A286UEJ1_9AGAM|nr:hypothetical protein PNOK_0650200 [Pyrrhoderma noxium]